MQGLYNIQVNTSSLADGHSLAAYLTSAAGTLLTHTTVGLTERLDVMNLPDHLDGTAYAAGVDYLSSMGAVDESGNWQPLNINTAGELLVAATVNMTADYPEDSAHVSGDIGLFSLAVRRDVRSSGVDTDGDYASFNVNSVGELWTKDADTLARLVLINTDTTSIANTLTALSKSEDAAHVSGDQGIQALAVRNDTPGSLVNTNGDYAPLQVDATGNLRITGSVTLATQYAEDSVANSGDIGSFSLAVRRDASGSNAANGDYTEFQTWSEGSLRTVDIANAAMLQQQVSVTSTATALPTTALTNRRSLMIQNTGSASFWVGSATVTTSGATAGLEVPKAAFLELEVGPAVTVYARTAGASQNANILEMS